MAQVGAKFVELPSERGNLDNASDFNTSYGEPIVGSVHVIRAIVTSGVHARRKIVKKIDFLLYIAVFETRPVMCVVLCHAPRNVFCTFGLSSGYRQWD